MSDLLTLGNLATWITQTTILAGAAAVLSRMFRARAARWHLVYLHCLMGACVLLPALQPWQRPEVRWMGRHARMAPAALDLQISNSQTLDWAPYALAAGFGCRAIWLCFGMFRLRRYRANARPLAAVPAAVAEAARMTGAYASFAVSGDISGPVTFGWRSPAVLVTPAFEELPHGQQLAIACHELTHVGRGDWLTSLGEEFFAAALWFHPGIWWLLRQIRLAREQVVDQAVIASTGSRRDYVEALLKMAHTRWQLDLSPAPLFLGRRHLVDRVQQIVKEATMSRRSIYTSYASTLTLLVVTAWFTFNGLPLKATPDDPKPEFQSSGDKRVRLAPEVARTKRIYAPRPAYPLPAKISGTQGIVKLAVLIGKDGHVSGSLHDERSNRPTRSRRNGCHQLDV